jgi:hypothetical protein
MAEGLISNNGTKTEEQSHADPAGRLGRQRVLSIQNSTRSDSNINARWALTKEKHHTRKAKVIFTAMTCLHLLYAGFLLGLFFHPADRGKTFLQNSSSLSKDYLSLLHNIKPLKLMIQIQGLPILQVFIICFLAYMGHNY